jgi:S1-C subfamily serine protease
MDDKKRIQTTKIIISIIGILILVGIWIYPSVYEYRCKTRHYEDFEKKITDNVLESNIVIIKSEKEKVSENDISLSYGAGASGIIFDKEGDTYYALTAYHVVKDFENADYIIIPYGEPSYSEYRKNSELYVPLEMYYEQFAKATVVFGDEEYDLAVISFESKEPLNALSINQHNPQYHDKIMAISNPEGERFIYSFGTINSKDYHVFETNDGLLSVNTFKHNAYVNHGSSGSVALNEEMKIVGINIGGGTDFLNRYRFGVMVPCELILEFLEKNGY